MTLGFVYVYDVYLQPLICTDAIQHKYVVLFLLNWFNHETVENIGCVITPQIEHNTYMQEANDTCIT